MIALVSLNRSFCVWEVSVFLEQRRRLLFEISHRFIDHFYDEGKIESEGREKSLRFYGPGLLINFVCVWSDQRERRRNGEKEK